MEWETWEMLVSKVVSTSLDLNVSVSDSARDQPAWGRDFFELVLVLCRRGSWIESPIVV